MMASKLKQLNEGSKEENLLVLYKWLGDDINSDRITNFSEVYDYVPKSTLADDLSVNRAGFLRTKYKDGQLWRLTDISKFCELTGADPVKVFNLLFKYVK